MGRKRKGLRASQEVEDGGKLTKPGSPGAAKSTWLFSNRRVVIPALVVLMLGVAYGSYLALRPAGGDSKPIIPATPSSQSVRTGSYAKLVGRWARSDGDYIVHIRNVGEDGRMDAAYFNPNPINVGKAEASPHAGTVKVYVQLQDENYPGSAYTLTYNVANDQLEGTYFQAVEQQTFPVSFTRVE